jgi:cytochrome c5
MLTRRWLLLAGGLLGLLSLAVWGASGLGLAPNQSVPTPTLPPMMSVEHGITKYSDFATPGADQAGVGAEIYDNWCITCHGDQGQGLTAAWRAEWDPAHQNCWQSKCHSVNHPPGGFLLPRTVPAIVGAKALAGFPTASDLQAFISQKMPFQDPGVLDQDAYWALTAYLLEQNGVVPVGQHVSSDNAQSIPINQ